MFLCLPMLDLLFCIDFKTSKPVTKDIVVTQIELGSIKEFSYKRGTSSLTIFKLISSNGEEFYVLDEELEKSLYSTINTPEYIFEINGYKDIIVGDEKISELLNTTDDFDYLEKYNAKYKYLNPHPLSKA